MIKNLYIFSFILLVGLLFTPTNTSACGTKSVKTEKSCCKNNKSDKKCCSEGKSGTKEKGCKGKCGHSNCTTTCGQASMTFVNTIDFELNKTVLFSKKSSFTYINNNISSGYFSLWLIPKIS